MPVARTVLRHDRIFSWRITMATTFTGTRECALITGASSGIGYHLAREFAANGQHLALVAPDQAELDQIATRLGDEFGVDVLPIGCDLEHEASAERVAATVADAGLVVHTLVNNAGHGHHGLFWQVPLATHLSLLRLNVEAVLRLTSRILPEMVSRGRGRLLNVASVAGFEPGPTVAVYHATKAFVLSWSEALAVELEDTGVSVTTLCPGPTDTDFFPKAGMLETRAFQKAALMAPQDVAAAGYKALMAGDRLVIPGASNKAMVFARRFMTENAQAKMNEALYQEVDPEDRSRQRGDKERETPPRH
jgi:short-subunit dehydrogenase